MTATQQGDARRGPGRPAAGTGPDLTRDDIVRTALRVAGAQGFPALTMHGLARELRVTPRALYNHVSSRQDLVDAVASLMMQELPEPRFDAADWRSSLRTAYREARNAYRRFPRATLISLDETVTPGEVDPRRLLLAEHMLRFFVDVGLDLDQAVALRGAFLLDVFGFALMIDLRYDASGPEVRAGLGQPVPTPWLLALPDVPVPLAREAAALPELTSDALFDRFVDLRVAAIESLLDQAHTGD